MRWTGSIWIMLLAAFLASIMSGRARLGQVRQSVKRSSVARAVGRCGATTVALLCASAACGAAPTLQASAESVSLCAGAAQEVRMAAATDDAAGLAGAALRWEAPSGVDVALDPLPGVPADAAGKSAAWLLKLTARSDSAVPGAVHVFLVQSAAKGTPQLLASTTFKVQSAIGADAFPAKLEVDSAVQNINEGQRAPTQVTLTNQSGTPLTITGLRIGAGEFDVTEPGAADDAGKVQPEAAVSLPLAPGEVAAGSQWVRAFDVVVGSKARPASGAHRIQASLDVVGVIGGCRRSATLVAHKDIGFAMLGNEGILTAVGIPSFLLVPGFLILMTMDLMWKFGVRPRRVTAATAFPFPPKESEFWVLAITLSLPLLLLPGAAQRFANYRIDDVATVWMYSLCAGVTAYLAIVLVLNAVDAAIHARALSEGDSAEAALKKLPNLTHGTLAPTVQVDFAKAGLGATGSERRLMPKWVNGTAWTIPTLNYDWRGGSPDAQVAAEIDAARGAHDLPRLVDVLLRALAASLITLEWDASSPLRRPAQVALAARAEYPEAEIVQEKP